MPATMNDALRNAFLQYRYPMALVLGVLLGHAVLLMSTRSGAGWLNFGISTLFVAAASASFVLCVLGLQQLHRAQARAVLSRRAHALAGTIGLGLLLALQLLA